MRTKTHIVADPDSTHIYLFSTEEACNRYAKEGNDNDGGADFRVLPAALFLSEHEVVTETPGGPSIESVCIYRHISGDYLFGVDGSYIEQEIGKVYSPIDGKEIFPIDSLDPDTDGCAKTS